jgi:hypothetical protein
MSVGMVIMRPTSVVVAGAGSSASVRAAGGVEFATATSLSLNGVFTADYDDYMVVTQLRSNGAAANINGRLRSAGTDASATNYTAQILAANGSSVSTSRNTSQTSATLGTTDDLTERCGNVFHIYGPNLAQPTAFRSIGMRTLSGAWVQDIALTHSLSTAYDGITLIPSSGSLTGQLTVFGLAQ